LGYLNFTEQRSAHFNGDNFNPLATVTAPTFFVAPTKLQFLPRHFEKD